MKYGLSDFAGRGFRCYNSKATSVESGNDCASMLKRSDEECKPRDEMNDDVCSIHKNSDEQCDINFEESHDICTCPSWLRDPD